MTRPLRAALPALAFAAATLGAAARADPPPPTAVTPGQAALLAGEDPAQGTTVPELGEPLAGALVGKPIRRVEVVTVGGRWASSPALTSVRPGMPATSAAARRLLRELLAQGGFARANVELFAEGDGVVLRLNVLPMRIITGVKVSGGALGETETLDAAGIAVGGEITAPTLAEAEARMRRFYEAHGFPAAEVSVNAADTDQPGQVVVSIDIVAGKPRTLKQRVFVMDPAAEREVGDLRSSYRVGSGARVDEPALADADRELTERLRQHGFFRAAVKHGIRAEATGSYLYVFVTPGPRLVPAFDGNHAYDAGDLEGALNLDKSPDDRAGELTDRLRAFYVARGFLDAEVSMVEKGKPEDPVHYLAFTIREHPQVRVVKRVFPCLTGDLSADDVGREIGSYLEEELPGSETLWPPDPRQVERIFGPGGPSGGRGAPTPQNPLVTYAPETYDRAVKHVKDLLHSKGYLNAVVGPLTVIRATCSRRSPAGECVPVLPRAAIEARCLKDSLGLPLPEPPVPSAFTCRPDPAHDVECSPEITLRIPVAPGPQTALWDLAFDGNRALSSAALGRIAALALGTPLSSVELEAARLRVLDAYRMRGYAYAEVVTSEEPSPDRTRARIRFYVTERDPVLVTGFVVKGATRTSQALILGRVALKPGEPFRQDWARQTEERIATLGTLSSVSVSLEDADVPARQKRVVITVMESVPQHLEARPGFSSGDGARLAFEWGHKNLGGQAISVTLRLQLSYLFDFLIPDPSVQRYYDALSSLERLEQRNTLSFAFPEIGLGPLVRLTLDAIAVRDNERDYGITKLAIAPTLTYRPFRQITTQLGASTEGNDVAIFNAGALSDTLNLLRAPEGESVALAQWVSFTADYRDNPLNATKGAFFTTGLEHVNTFPVAGAAAAPGPPVLGDAHGLVPVKVSSLQPVDTASLRPGQGLCPTNAPGHFLRFTGRVAGYLPVDIPHLTPKGTTLAVSFGFGYNRQLTACSSTYPDRLFFLGGGDSLRSYLSNALVPDDVASSLAKRIVAQQKNLAGQVYSISDVAQNGGDLMLNPRLELRVPITGLFATGLFLDGGNVWQVASDITSTVRFPLALGAGVRLQTPIGPLAFDYGFNLWRWSFLDEAVGAFHFSIGVL